MGSRRKGRELAVQALYQIEVRGSSSPNELAMFWEQADAGERAREFAAELIAGTREHQRDIDKLISAAAQNWKLDRLAPVDLCVLRIASYELMEGDRPPTSVVINEAIEVVRKFGTVDSSKFVHGVLDHIATKLGVKERPGEEKQEVDE